MNFKSQELLIFFKGVVLKQRAQRAKLLPVFFVLCLIHSASLFAFESAIQSELEAGTGSSKTKKPLRGTLSQLVETGLHKWDSSSHSVVGHTVAGVTLTSPGGVRNSVEILLSKRLDNYRESAFSDVGWTLSGFSRALTPVLTLSGSAGLVLPLSLGSRKSRSLLMGAEVAPGLTFDAGRDWLTGLKVRYVPSVTRYVHRYTQQVSGEPNSRYALSNQLIFSYAFADRMNLLLEQAYTRRWSYGGTSRDSFSFGQAVSYNFAENWEAVIGHYIGGSALHINGSDSDVRFFDDDVSRIYMGLGWKL